MPTRKQRRRRAKDQRHEWEYVVYDDEGREVEVDRAELRKEREQQRDGNKPAKAAARNGKPATQPRDRKGRPLRPQKPPTWRRAATRAGIFAVALLVFTSFLNQKNTQWGTRILIAVAYGLVAIPFFYFMDRATYRRYLRMAGREDEIKPRR
jgi:hypothetical protein